MMDLEAVRPYLLAKKGAVEERPFGPDTLVFKVMGKMFALVGENDRPLRINLKCDPDQALFLRDMYPAVLPGYHMNKKHWNTVVLDGSLPTVEIEHMIDDSYNLIVNNLPKTSRTELENLE